MKIKNITEETKEFKPVKLEITIESRDELMELHQRLNMSYDDVFEHRKNNYYFPKKTHTGPLFWAIDKVVDMRGSRWDQ